MNDLVSRQDLAKSRPLIIAPSLLASDQSCLGDEAKRAERCGADWLHLDIMDGHFVPNLSFGPRMIKAIRSLTKLFFDVHLMCSRPEVLLEAFAAAGADEMIVHVELGAQVPLLIREIKALGKKVGLAVNPRTPIDAAQPFLEEIDLLLVMTVHPGFGGQKFIRAALPKIRRVEAWRREKKLSYRVGVDGGINVENAAECARAGADAFIAGTSLFGVHSLKAAVTQMRRSIAAANVDSP